MVSRKKYSWEGKPSAQTNSHMTMDKPPVSSASSGQKKFEHCVRKVPARIPGYVNRTMVTRPNKQDVEDCLGPQKAKCNSVEISKSVDCSLDLSIGKSGSLARQESHHSALPRHLQIENDAE